MPLIRDDTYPHVNDKKEHDKFLKWLRHKNNTSASTAEADKSKILGDLTGNFGKKKKNAEISSLSSAGTSKLDFKIRGDYMKPFQSFYGPKTFASPLSDVECAKL